MTRRRAKRNAISTARQLVVDGRAYDCIVFQYSLFGGVDVHGWGGAPPDTGADASGVLLGHFATLHDAQAAFSIATGVACGNGRSRCPSKAEAGQTVDLTDLQAQNCCG